MRVPDVWQSRESQMRMSLFLRGLGVTESGNTFDTFSHIYFKNRTDSIITHYRYFSISPSPPRFKKNKTGEASDTEDLKLKLSKYYIIKALLVLRKIYLFCWNNATWSRIKVLHYCIILMHHMWHPFSFLRATLSM
jgi:hypothetical protein